MDPSDENILVWDTSALVNISKVDLGIDSLLVSIANYHKGEFIIINEIFQEIEAKIRENPGNFPSNYLDSFDNFSRYNVDVQRIRGVWQQLEKIPGVSIIDKKVFLASVNLSEVKVDKKVILVTDDFHHRILKNKLGLSKFKILYSTELFMDYAKDLFGFPLIDINNVLLDLLSNREVDAINAVVNKKKDVHKARKWIRQYYQEPQKNFFKKSINSS